MGATLADGGVNPITKERVVDPSVCHYALAVMTTAGLYETSGDWLYDIGLPGKSGIGGGIVTVSPGKGGLGTFAPPLDARATASRDNSSRNFCPSGWGWICLFPSLKSEFYASSSLSASRSQSTDGSSTMSARSISASRRHADSWVPMIAIALGQMIMSFNVASLAGRDRRHGAKLRRSAHDDRNRHRRLFDAGRRLCHARCETHAALRRGACIPRRRCRVLRFAGADDIQPLCDS